MRLVMLHLLNEVRLALYLKRRYWFETVLGLGFLLILFGGLLYAVGTVSGKSFDSGALDTMIIGFVLWQFAVVSYSSASNDVAEETRQRTVEQLYIVPIPLTYLLGLRAFLHLLGGVLVLLLAFAVISALTAGRLRMDFLPMVGAVLLAAPSLVGIGYAVAGLLLLVKKAELAQGVMYLALISLVALPAYPVNAFALLPYALGAATARAAAEGTTIAPEVYAIVIANSAMYLWLGLTVFWWMERRAKRLGVIGHW